MSKCLYCGAEIAEDEKFCAECGQPVKEAAEQPKRKSAAAKSEPKQSRGVDSIIMLITSIALVLFAVFFVAALVFGKPGGSKASASENNLTAWDGTSTAAVADSAGPERIVIKASGSSPASSDDKDDKKDEETAAESEEETEEEAASEPKVNTYLLVEDDCTWEEAYTYCEEFGGHLVTITSEEEYEAVCEVVNGCGLTYLWVGATCDNAGVWEEWITGESFSFDKWYPGEPTGTDGDGTLENCLCMWNVNDSGWTFNDLRNDLISAVPTASGKVGFVIEFE